MGRPRTRSLTKAGNNDDSGKVVQTEQTPLVQQSKANAPTRQNKQVQPILQSGQHSKFEQSKQSRKKGVTLGRPRKNQPKKSNKIKKKSQDEVIFEEMDDPRDEDYLPNVNYTVESSSKKNRANLNFRRTPGTRLPNVNLLPMKSDSSVYPAIQNLIQGTSSSGNISDFHDTSMNISNALLPNHLQYSNYTQAGSTSRMTPKPINPTERIMPQITNNYMPMREIPPPRVVPIPSGRDDVRSETEFNRNLQSLSNETQSIHINNPSITNHISNRTEHLSSRNIQDQFPSVSHQHSPMNQEAYTSAQSNNTSNASHMPESRETGSTTCDICHSTGCSTQKTSTTITIKMTTVTEADQFGNMTTRTFVETDITPVAGSIESTDKTEILVEADENENRSNNVAPTTSSIASDQNIPNETSSPATPQETEIQESEQNRDHIDQQITQEPASISVPTSFPVSDPVYNPDPNPYPDPVFNPIPSSVPKPVVFKPVPQPIPLNLPSIIASSSQTAARLENANIIHHNHALQNLLSTTQQNQLNQLNLSANANLSQSQQPRINRPILPAQNQPLQPRPERLKHNIESIINSVNSSPKSTTVNSSNLLRNQTSGFMIPLNSTNDDVNRIDSFTGLQDLDGMSESSPSTRQSQTSPSKKKTTTKKRSASKSTAPSASKRKNQRILPNKNPSEAQIVISPYMMKAANTFMSGNNSTIQDVAPSSTEVGSSQQCSSPYLTFIDTNSQSLPYYNSPPRPPIFHANDATSASINSMNSTNALPIATTPHNNYSEISRGTSSTTPHSNSTIQPSNSSTPQVSSSSNTCVFLDPYNNPFVMPRIGGSSSESTPTVQYNNNDILVRSGSSSKTISTNGGGVGYDSHSSPVVNSLEPLPPYYHMIPIETMGSVTDIWNEWNVGINGNPSVILMMERYGGKWVYENEYHLRKRRIIVKEVQVRSEQIGIYDALAELERLRNGNSLLWLADWIRTRE
ncbi:11104_t:CDS:2 [Funneliformis mosseae]|uniref:11104_t:CDS:1 n=1 Tax=Funneliformis mosseae TaxID=27381 RepID=A0A9N9AS91_FUNMO|nr:11104_t:CDS:2 [Funneliformis mosseae]